MQIDYQVLFKELFQAQADNYIELLKKHNEYQPDNWFHNTKWIIHFLNNKHSKEYRYALDYMLEEKQKQKDHFVLHGINIEKIPTVFYSGLKSITFSDLLITDFPTEMFLLKQLEHLTVRNCPIVSLANLFYHFHQLKSLVFSHCQISLFQASFQLPSSIEVLNLEYNFIRFLPFSILQSEAKEVYLQGNPITDATFQLVERSTIFPNATKVVLFDTFVSSSPLEETRNVILQWNH